MPYRVIIHEDNSELFCTCHNNDADAEALIAAFENTRELTQEELSVFGSDVSRIGDGYTIISGTDIATCVVTRDVPEPTEVELTKQRIAEIQQQLTANDFASVRPLRAKVAGTATPEDKTRLAELEEQAQALRSELATLNTKLQELSDQPTE